MAAAAHVDRSAEQPTATEAQQGGCYSLFFYGTLVHPSILLRMIGHVGATLTVQPAVLEGYVLHHVKAEEYPGLVPVKESNQVMAHAAGAEQSLLGGAQLPAPATAAVRGMLVHGLSGADVRKLDLFEGDEYIRTLVAVLPDEHVAPTTNDKRPRDASIEQVLSSLTPERIQAILAQRPPAQPCHVYRWHAPLSMLEPRVWTFETFMSSGNHQKWWNG